MESLRFNNGKFKIVQFTDIQEIADFSPDTERLIRAVLACEEPDFAVLTGDQIKGYGITMRIGDARENARKVIEKITSCFDDFSVPFTVTFGNHDEFCGITKAEQWAMYKSSPYFIDETENSVGVGIGNIPIYGSDGKVRFGIYCFDSGGKDKKAGTYQTFPAEQIDWFRNRREELKEENGDYIPSIAFQHIPIPEVYELMDEASSLLRDAVRGAGNRADKYYVLGDNVNSDGFMGENAAVPAVNSGEFEALCEKGDILGIYFGHDHNNSFCGKLNGVDVGYTQSCGFNVYGPGTRRGARVFDLNESEPRAYISRTVTYGELFGKSYERPVRSVAYNFAPSSVGVCIDAAKKAAAAALPLAIIIGAAAIKNKRK